MFTTHAGGTPVIPHVYANVEGWRTLEVQRSKEQCVEISILLRQYAKEYILGYIYAATPKSKANFGPKCMKCTWGEQKFLEQLAYFLGVCYVSAVITGGWGVGAPQ